MQYEKKLAEHSKYTNKHTHTNSRKVVNLSVQNVSIIYLNMHINIQ
jgi:hypothetical protein